MNKENNFIKPELRQTISTKDNLIIPTSSRPGGISTGGGAEKEDDQKQGLLGGTIGGIIAGALDSGLSGGANRLPATGPVIETPKADYTPLYIVGAFIIALVVAVIISQKK